MNNLTAKEYEQIQKSLHKVDRDKAFHFKLGSEEEYVQYLINDAIRSMMENVKKYGTSQDPSTWENPPEYSVGKKRKGFVMMIVKFRNKFRGLARSMEGGIDLKTDWFEDMNSAGKQIIKYIDMFRKQAKMSRLDELLEQRNRAKERSKLIIKGT